MVLVIERIPTSSPRSGPAQKKFKFDVDRFLSTIGVGRTSLQISAKQRVFTQGDATEAVFYIRKGNIKLSVLSSNGKEATIGILGAGTFFGEACLAGQLLRPSSASAVTNCDILRIDKKTMLEALRGERKLSDVFVASLLARNIRYEEDLVDQLFNSSEKRLARVLLLLVHFGQEDAPDHVIPEISQTTLAEMVGTTRPRINFFMKKFRNQGFIDYEGGLRVHSSLLKVLLAD